MEYFVLSFLFMRRTLPKMMGKDNHDGYRDDFLSVEVKLLYHLFSLPEFGPRFHSLKPLNSLCSHQMAFSFILFGFMGQYGKYQSIFHPAVSSRVTWMSIRAENDS